MSGSSNDEGVGVLAPAGSASAITEAAEAHFHPSLSDITGEDLQLLVAQRVTSAPSQPGSSPSSPFTSMRSRGRRSSCSASHSVLSSCIAASSHYALATPALFLSVASTPSHTPLGGGAVPQNESAAASHPGRASDNLLFRISRQHERHHRRLQLCLQIQGQRDVTVLVRPHVPVPSLTST